MQGDFNDANIIMKTENNKATDEVYGVIDFGDMVYSCLVNDVAIGCITIKTAHISHR